MLLWKVKLTSSGFVDWTAAQFAVAIDGATRKPRAFFPGFFGGVYAVGE